MTEQTAPEIKDVQRLRLRPGDRLVAVVPGDTLMEEVAAIKDRLAAEFPGVPILVHPEQVSVFVAEVESVLKYFAYGHLPPRLQEISGPCHDLAQAMVANLPAGSELAEGLRKLLEAKDCFVRAAL
jgi:hypothetical protein